LLRTTVIIWVLADLVEICTPRAPREALITLYLTVRAMKLVVQDGGLTFLRSRLHLEQPFLDFV
jgi:hypothetical protein